MSIAGKNIPFPNVRLRDNSIELGYSAGFQPLVSFCIPTYNRSGSLFTLVNRLLENQSSEFEVVVLDNGSTDNTLDQLAQIKDPRLVVLANGANYGAIYNQVSVLLQGQGKYSVLLLDKDCINPILIEPFLEFLRKGAPHCGFCAYDEGSGRSAEFFAKGVDALNAIGYICHHPTGYFFLSKDLRDINSLSRFVDFDFVGNFSFEFMQAELCLRGRAAIYYDPLFIPETLECAAAIKSFTINGSKQPAFFTPQGRLKMAVNFSRHITSLALPVSERRRLIARQFIRGLKQSTFEYFLIMKNKAICEHYHIEPKSVNFLEILHAIWIFSFGFSRQMKEQTKKEFAMQMLDVPVYIVQRIFHLTLKRLKIKSHEAS